MEPVAISMRDAAKVLSLGRTTIYKTICIGRREISKVGSRALVKTASIRRLVEGEIRREKSKA